MAFIPPMIAAVGSFLAPAFGVGTATAGGVATGATTATSVLAAGGTQAAIGLGTSVAAAKLSQPKMKSDTKAPIAMPDEDAIKLSAQRQMAQRKGSRSQSILTTSDQKLGG